MKRRTVLKNIVATGTCLTCAKIAEAAGGHNAPWDYSGAGGPKNWGALSPEYATCSGGMHQSPVNLTKTTPAALPDLRFDYGAVPLEILNNGHTIQVNYARGSHMTVNGRRYDLKQFHFHHPSEHAVDGLRYDMEVHFVHMDENKNLAVLGVFLSRSRVNQAIAPIWDHMPMFPTKPRVIPNVMVNAADMLPRDHGVYQYYGSLTTPPCSEGVHWIVMRESIGISPEQLAKFASIFPMNARPVQDKNRRFFLHTQ